MLKADMLPAVYIPSRLSMENKLLLRSRISLVRIRTQIKNKIHAIIDRNRDCYLGLENLTDTFGKTGMFLLRNTKILKILSLINNNNIISQNTVIRKICKLQEEMTPAPAVAAKNTKSAAS